MKPPRNQAGPHTTPLTLGSIRGDEIQPLRLFCQNFGIGKKAWAALAQRGFPTIAVGKQKLVDGAAALAYFRKLAAADQAQGDVDQNQDGGPGATQAAQQAAGGPGE